MSKRMLISVLLVAAVAVLITITRVWAVIELDVAAAAQTTVEITGSDGIQALMPVAIALIAVALVLGIAGRVLRVVLGGLTAIFGGWISWVIWASTQRGDTALIDFASRAITEATGLVTSDSAQLVTGVEATFWPWVTMASGLVVALTGVAIVVFGWRWTKGGQRYETHTSKRSEHRTVDRIAEWDALSDGEDPSDWEGEELDR